VATPPEVSSPAAARWAWWSVAPLGLGAWAPAYAGARARRASWWALGLLWSLITLAGWILAVSSDGKSGIGGGLIILGWVGAVASSFTIRPAYDRLVASPFTAALSGGEQRLAERRQARELARDNPKLALEIGVGRPDLPGSRDAGLIDVNNAPAAMLERLPGVDHQLAATIDETRRRVGGFSSLEDFGATCDLDGDLVEDIRERTVFLPR
jgi:hypothetical protein